MLAMRMMISRGIDNMTGIYFVCCSDLLYRQRNNQNRNCSLLGGGVGKMKKRD